MAMKVIELELTQEIAPVWGCEGYDGLCALVRCRGQVVGWVYLNQLNLPAVSAARLREVVTAQLGWDLVPMVLGPQRSDQPRPDAPPISVVVVAQDAREQLDACLQALRACAYPDYELIVVGPTAAQAVAERAKAVFVREERREAAWARNRGLAVARHPLVAFTSATARPDRGWLDAIGQAFADPAVMAVTGLVAPAELETAAQMRFEFNYGGLGRGIKRRVIRPGTVGPQELLTPQSFGAGVNMALRREAFAAVGLFDPGLDIGAAPSGSDVELLQRLLSRSHTLLYEPAALVWHTHRRSDAALCRVVFDNGRARGRYLRRCARNDTLPQRHIYAFALRQLGGLVRRLVKPEALPHRLIALELVGMVLGFAARPDPPGQATAPNAGVRAAHAPAEL